MFLKRSMICRASMSWEAETQGGGGQPQGSKGPRFCARLGSTPGPVESTPVGPRHPPARGGCYLPAVVPHFEDGRLPGDLLAVGLLRAALLLGI